MADNVLMNAGSGGETAATDDCAGVQYQRVKLTDGTADSTTVIAAGTGTGATSLRVNLATDVALPAGTNAIGKLAANSGVDIGDVDVTTLPAVTIAAAQTLATVTTVGTVSSVTAIANALPAGTNAIGKLAANSGVDIGDVDVTSVPADPFGSNADAASATGSISAKLRFIAGTGIPVTGTVTVASHAVTNAGTFATQPAGSVAHDGAAAAVNPVLTGAYASAAAPSDVSADNDAVRIWALRNGSQVVNLAAAGALIGATSNALDVNIKSGAGSGGTAMADDAAFTPATTSVTPIGAFCDDTGTDSVDENDIGAVRMSANRNLYVRIRDNAGNERGLNIDAAGALAAVVTNAGTFAVQNTAQASTNTQEIVGDVAHDGVAAGNPVLIGARASAAVPADVSADNDVTELWALRSGALAVQPTMAGVLAVAGNGASGTGVQRVTIANDSTGILATVSTVTTVSTLTGGAVAHDGADSGNPVKVGAKCSLTLADDTIVANADRTDLTSDGDGALLVRESFPLQDLLSERVSNTDGASTAFSTFGATANAKNHITAYSIFRTDAGTTPIYVDFRDGTAGAVLWSVVLPPNGGANLASSVPLFRNATANTALAFDVSAATSTVYISISGFKSKVA